MPDSCLCLGCLKDIRHLYRPARQHCPLCGHDSVAGVVCGRCQTDPPSVDAFWASAFYVPPIPILLHEFKHLRHLDYGAVLTQIMLENPPSWLMMHKIDGLLAMPLSIERRLQRGFNQCDVLAHTITQHYKIPALRHSVVKRVHKTPQSMLNARERRENVRQMFAPQDDVKNQKILIIDDVSTTRSSVFELARCLKQAGASAVFVWVMACNG